jgi:hypothetical protein
LATSGAGIAALQQENSGFIMHHFRQLIKKNWRKLLQSVKICVNAKTLRVRQSENPDSACRKAGSFTFAQCRHPMNGARNDKFVRTCGAAGTQPHLQPLSFVLSIALSRICSTSISNKT